MKPFHFLLFPVIFAIVLILSALCLADDFEGQVALLNDDKFMVRQQAKAEIIEMGVSILPRVTERLAEETDVETRYSLSYIKGWLTHIVEITSPLPERLNKILARNREWKRVLIPDEGEGVFDGCVPPAIRIDLTTDDLDKQENRDAIADLFERNLTHFDIEGDWWAWGWAEVPRPIILIYPDHSSDPAGTREELWEFIPKGLND